MRMLQWIAAKADLLLEWVKGGAMRALLQRCVVMAVVMLVGGVVSAQQDYTILSGRVTDSDTREGLPGVTVCVAGQAVYTQTNGDGEYVLKVPTEYAEGSVVYALMGYRRDTVPMDKAQQRPDVALVTDGGRWLKEVTVTEYSGKAAAQLLKDAVDRIPQNYWTDTTVGTWFYRDVRMLNGELFLFDEMVFEALRVGYDKHHSLKKLMNSKGPGNAVRIDYKRPIESNYTSIKHDRLLLHDTGYVSRVTNGIADAYIDYNENEVLYDPVEVPNTTRLSEKNLKRAARSNKYTMQEVTDADGKEYYVLTSSYNAAGGPFRGHGSVRYTIAKGSLAIVSIEENSYFVMRPFFPLKKKFKEAGVDSMAISEQEVYHYGLVEGKYTLTSYSRREGLDMYGKRVEHMEKRCQCVMTGQQRGDSSFLKNNVIQQPGSVLVTQRRADSKEYDEDFWRQYNYIPLEAAVRSKLEAKLKK